MQSPAAKRLVMHFELKVAFLVIAVHFEYTLNKLPLPNFTGHKLHPPAIGTEALVSCRGFDIHRGKVGESPNVANYQVKSSQGLSLTYVPHQHLLAS